MQSILIRQVFIPSQPFRPLMDEVLIEDDEWIINIETVAPNQTTGCGVRTWIGKLNPAAESNNP